MARHCAPHAAPRAHCRKVHRRIPTGSARLGIAALQ
jgi:hypothetical protein